MKLSLTALAQLSILALLVSYTLTATPRSTSQNNIIPVATCYGKSDCKACKNCKYCKHCAKDGGECGVCK